MTNHAFLNTTIFKAGAIAFALVCCLLLLPGCESDSAWQEPEPETEVTETTEPETEAADAAEEADTDSQQSNEIYDQVPGDVDGWDVPANAGEFLTPSQEEIDQAMMYDAQQAMYDYYEYDEGYIDYDTSLGRSRGR